MSDIEKLKLSERQQIPIIGLGTFQSNEEEADKLLENALEIGYRFIDTAFIYGNEDSLGIALAKRFKEGKIKREDLFITTKLPAHGLRRDLVKHFLELSLKRLQLDYVDLYLVHTPIGVQYVDDNTQYPKDEDGSILWDKDTDHVEVWKGMEEVQDLGLTKAIGLSNFNSIQIQRILDNCRIKPANLQVECHLYLQQKELVEFCQRKGITVTAYTPLGNPNISDLEKKFGLKKVEHPVPLKDPILGNIAIKYNKTPAQILLRWLTQRKIIVIPRSTNPNRLRENFQIFDFTLESDDIEQLEAVDKKHRVYEMENFAPGIKDHPEYPYSVPF